MTLLERAKLLGRSRNTHTSPRVRKIVPATSTPGQRNKKRLEAEAAVSTWLARDEDYGRLLRRIVKAEQIDGSSEEAFAESLRQRAHVALEHAPHDEETKRRLHAALDQEIDDHLAEQRARDGTLLLKPTVSEPAKPVTPAPVVPVMPVRVDKAGRRLADPPRRCKPGDVEKIIERSATGAIVRVVEVRH